MTRDAENGRTASTRPYRRFDTPAAALAALLLITTAMRVTVMSDRPLWLDEVWTGMIVSQPSFHDFVRQCSDDVNAPLYSILAAIWAQVSGISNVSLRILPAASGIIAPLIALGSRTAVGRPERFTWCALLACWIPGLWHSWEARPYTLTFALGVANAAAFASLLMAPTLKRSWIWTGLSSLLILSHYYGAILIAVQGIAFLAIYKQRALRTWVSGVAFAPVLATVALQAASIRSFGTPGHSWIPLMDASGVLWAAAFVFGHVLLIFGFLIWWILVILLRNRSEQLEDKRADLEHRLLWVVPICALTAALIAIGIGFMKPIFIVRYLTPFVPGIFLGVALLAARLARRWELATTTLIALFFSGSVLWALKPPKGENAFNFEVASQYLMSAHPTRLVFMWDTPLAPDSSSLAAAGGFFFRRAGNAIPVDGVNAAKGVDPNRLLLQHAATPGSAILWFYDLKVQGTAAIQYPPALAKIDPRWRCRDFADSARFGILACFRPI